VGTLVAPFADEAGNLGSLSLKNGTGSSSVTVKLASGRKAPCTIYVALLPGVNFSQGFRLRYNYDEQSGPGFAYTSNRSIARKKILNVGTLSNRIHTDWFVKTDGTISDPSQGGNSWDKALNTAGLVALLNQPTVDGVQDNALAYDKACVLDGATIHIAQGNYTLSELKLSATGYDNLVKVRILGSYPTGLTGTNTSATRDVVNKRTTFAGNGSSRILLVEDKVDLALDKLWFSGGRSAVDKTHEAGTALSAKSTAIDQASNLSLSHCGFEDNVASGLNADGGAVYLSRATAYMENCEFKNNSCGGGQIGGAINLYDDDYHATLTLKSCQFSGNKAGLSGGAISCSKGRLYISGTENSPTVFEENSVETSGRTTRGGALLLAYASSVEVEYTNFIGNYGIATGAKGTEGGAVAFAETSYGSFEHVSFVGTKEASTNAVRNGAHVSMDNTSDPAQATTFKNCSFTNGQASNVAGAIHIREYSKLSLENCSFANNTTSNFGGALHINNKNAQANFTDCTFSENSTKVYGGALSMEDGTCNFYNCSRI
jgi:predicted outer membrane repeat protein